MIRLSSANAFRPESKTDHLLVSHHGWCTIQAARRRHQSDLITFIGATYGYKSGTLAGVRQKRRVTWSHLYDML